MESDQPRPTLSPDGRFWWDGAAWQPMNHPPASQAPPKGRRGWFSGSGCFAAVILLLVLAVLGLTSKGGGQQSAPAVEVTPDPTGRTMSAEEYRHTLSVEQEAMSAAMDGVFPACDVSHFPSTIPACDQAAGALKSAANNALADIQDRGVPPCLAPSYAELSIALHAAADAADRIAAGAGKWRQDHPDAFKDDYSAAETGTAAFAAHVHRSETLDSLANC